MTEHDLKEMKNLGAELGAAKAEVERLRRHLQTAHSFIESTEAFGSAAATGILECAGVVWNIDESKALIAAMAAKEA